jgi:hypothetical protein
VSAQPIFEVLRGDGAVGASERLGHALTGGGLRRCPVRPQRLVVRRDPFLRRHGVGTSRKREARIGLNTMLWFRALPIEGAKRVLTTI